MNNSEQPEAGNGILTFSNIAGITTYAISLIFTFAIIKLFLYYYLFLHVPIFQYVEVSDMVLMFPTGVFWAIYMGAMEAGNWISDVHPFDKLENYFYRFLLYGLAFFITWYGFHNDPTIQQSLLIPIHYWFYLPILILYVVVRLKSKLNGENFLAKNRLLAAFILTIWYSMYDSCANYEALTKPSKHLDYNIRLKNGKNIRTINDLFFAGRSKSYWFLYNQKTHTIRSINNDNIDIIDFNTEIPQRVEKRVPKPLKHH